MVILVCQIFVATLTPAGKYLSTCYWLENDPAQGGLLHGPVRETSILQDQFGVCDYQPTLFSVFKYLNHYRETKKIVSILF